MVNVLLQTFIHFQVYWGGVWQHEGEWQHFCIDMSFPIRTLTLVLSHRQDKVTNNRETNGFERRSTRHRTWDEPFDSTVIFFQLKKTPDIFFPHCEYVQLFLTYCCRAYWSAFSVTKVVFTIYMCYVLYVYVIHVIFVLYVQYNNCLKCVTVPKK